MTRALIARTRHAWNAYFGLLPQPCPCAPDGGCGAHHPLCKYTVRWLVGMQTGCIMAVGLLGLASQDHRMAAMALGMTPLLLAVPLVQEYYLRRRRGEST